jgi:hypothetical protein
VLSLAAYWTLQLANTREVMGTDSAKQRWEDALADVDALAKPGKPDDVYAKNNEFWRTLGTLSDQLGAAQEAPTTWDLIKQTAANLPATVEHAVEDAGHAAKEGALALLKKPAVLLGGGLVALLLLTRRG